MNRDILMQVMAELERRDRDRLLNRYLRDVNDPFFTTEETFRKHYRLSREAGQDLFLEILPYIDNGRRVTKIPAVIKFVVALSVMAHGSYQKPVGSNKQCAMSQAAVSKCLHEIVEIMVEHLPQTYIKFPVNQNDVARTKGAFYEKFHFPGVLGCVDGTHVLIHPPPANNPAYPPRLFMNRHSTYSINCQVICDANLKILAVNASRYPGSVHDSAVWMMSNVKRLLLRNCRNGERNSWLLGDSGYPLEPFLLTPIIGADPATPAGRYTRAHISTRNSIERCIGVLKSYFRCLLKDRVLHYDPIFAAKIIYCCAVLHNILRTRNIEDNDIEIILDDDDDDPVDDNNLLRQGQNTRANVIQGYFNY